MCNTCRAQYGVVRTSHTSISIPNHPLQPQDSPLLGLPPEIRNMIYSYALIQPKPIHILCVQECREGHELGLSNDDFHWTAPALLQTCRQVRKEASLMYYVENSFITVDRGQWYLYLSSWLACLEAENMQSLQEVIVDSAVSDSERMFIRNFAEDLLQFWDELQPTELALSKDTLKMLLPAYKPIPTLEARLRGEKFMDNLSVARVERGCVFDEGIIEVDGFFDISKSIRCRRDTEHETFQRELREEHEARQRRREDRELKRREQGRLERDDESRDESEDESDCESEDEILGGGPPCYHGDFSRMFQH